MLKMVANIVYSTVGAGTVPTYISLIWVIEGAVIALANGYLVIRILLTKKLRKQRENIILVAIMLFEVLFGLDYCTNGLRKLILKAQYDFFPIADSLYCFAMLQLPIIMLPVAGYVLLITAMDRLICVYCPIYYMNLSLCSAYCFLVLPYICTIPTYVMSAVRATSDEQMAQNVSQLCLLSDAVGSEGYRILRGIRSAGCCLSTLIYIPIMLKIYKITKGATSTSTQKKFIKVTMMVSLINGNTLLMFSIPDTILFFISGMPAPMLYAFNLMSLNKPCYFQGMVNLFIIIFTQRALWARIFRPN